MDETAYGYFPFSVPTNLQKHETHRFRGVPPPNKTLPRQKSEVYTERCLSTREHHNRFVRNPYPVSWMIMEFWKLTPC